MKKVVFLILLLAASLPAFVFAEKADDPLLQSAWRENYYDQLRLSKRYLTKNNNAAAYWACKAAMGLRTSAEPDWNKIKESLEIIYEAGYFEMNEKAEKAIKTGMDFDCKKAVLEIIKEAGGNIPGVTGEIKVDIGSLWKIATEQDELTDEKNSYMISEQKTFRDSRHQAPGIMCLSKVNMSP